MLRIKEEDFYNFRPEIIFATDSERGVTLVGVWSNDDGGISFNYHVRFTKTPGVVGEVSRHDRKCSGLASAIRIFNEVK
jgi:hypothetical protein